MSDKKATGRQKAALLAITCILILIPLTAGELYCRWLTNINFLDNSRGMFAADKYAPSYGNTPNFQGVSFGEPFSTDENGFRFDPSFAENAAPGAPAVLIVGDSVTFGPAIAEDKTIAGIIRRRAASNARLYNASSIGFDTFDYQNVINAVVAQKPAINKVLLFFCLNDVNNLSAQQIRKQTNAALDAEEAANVPFFQKVNDYLRSRSKLYLWLKNSLRDTQMIYFQNDLEQYRKGDAYVGNALAPLAEIKKSLDARNVKLEVFVLPYEAQTRKDAPADFLQPQRMVDAYLEKNNIEHFDLTPKFQSQSSPKELFLYGDPMHLSERGNLLTADLVCAELADVCKIN